ncbi:hypothetical protein TNCV_2630401 [Trichonephila clavipes]|uniref:Uncharacterized protein n=1 Tax=Trichonephila clavipes TaxID=2585209 RepID=A0A8X6SF78_TRICX|nr:hypothetical protein TNCV_2630401 [Trichonephila clavipes]
MMGDLPRDRIVPSRPFEKVGLDYAGPIITKPNLKDPRQGDPSHPSFGVTMQRTSREQETFLMNGTKFASPTEFSYSAQRGNRMELHSTRFSPFRWIVGSKH